MAEKDTGGQKRAGRDDTEVDEVTAEPESDVADRKEKLDDDVDSILDDIDDVLEENSEDFVRSYVQKGGQ